MMNYALAALLPVFLVLSQSPALAASPEPGSSSPDAAAAWYFPAWLGEAPHAPVFQVRDTENKYGRHAAQTKPVTIKDLIKFHGHFCGGLVESAAAIRVAFDRLFAGGVVDRTDLRIASNNSACGGDVAVYPKEVKTQMKRIESGSFEPKDIELFQELQWAYAKRLVSAPLENSFIVEDGGAYAWPAATCKDLGRRKDNDFKSVPAK